MKSKFNKIVSTIFILLLFNLLGKAQSCDSVYIVISDMSGIDISPFQTDLTAKSCELRDSLPQEFINQFKVYDFGFYSLSEHMQGEHQAIWDKLISEISSEYYLLFGKQSGKNGIPSKFWVDIKLPETNIFECFTPEHRLFITNKIKTILEEQYNSLGGSIINYAESEKVAIDSLISIISKAKECCIPSNGLRRNPMSCTPCPDDFQFVESLFLSYGFNSIEVDNLTTLPKNDTTGIVDEYIDMTVEIGSDTINVNQDIKDFLGKLGSNMEGVHGEIRFYDYGNFECLDILSTVLGEDIGNLPSLKRNGVIQKKSSSVSEILYEVTVIGIIDDFGSSKLFIRTHTNFTSSSTGNTIYLQSLDGCCLDMGNVKSKVNNFYSLLGDYTFFNPPGTNIKETVSLVPNIEISTFLNADQVKNNTIVLFGEGSQLIGMAQGYYSDISGNWSNESDDSQSICKFLSNDGLLEMGQNPGNISLVRTELENYLGDFRCSTKEELAAFLALHATGHNAGIGHFQNLTSPYHGYMSQGCCIVKHYLSNFSPCSACSSGDGLYQNLEDMISKTMNGPHASYNSSIKEKIYERYIK